jgi:hypothetical protein
MIGYVWIYLAFQIRRRFDLQLAESRATFLQVAAILKKAGPLAELDVVQEFNTDDFHLFSLIFHLSEIDLCRVQQEAMNKSAPNFGRKK